MLLVFNIDGVEHRTMHAGDVSLCMDFADDIARLGYGLKHRGRDWIANFQRKAKNLGYARSSAVQCCTCSTLNGCHSPECGYVVRVGKFPSYAPPLPDDLPLIALPFEWPAVKWRPLRDFVRDAVLSMDTGQLRNSLKIETPRKHGKGLPVDDSIPLEAHGIPESDPDKIEA